MSYNTPIEARAALESTVNDSPRTHPPRVLVVEDNSDMREFLARVLSRQGYEFLEAADGEVGLHVARTQRPDLILMDISLPALDGFEATRQIKQDPAMAHIPIIAVTAHARPADEQRALEAGCDGYLSKPYSLREFLGVVAQILGQAGPQGQ